MARKTKELRSEAVNAAAKYHEMQRLIKEAEEEETKRLEELETQIQDITSNQGMFCGVRLTQQDILNIVKLAMETRETISIPFKLYYNE